ncbi:transcriptional regulator with XRE-family HTH domain [Streptomyces sp. SAI-041]|nr:transcriptional regulator with XRE-family HTH domain [Streptomyces sp. SAI-041]
MPSRALPSSECRARYRRRVQYGPFCPARQDGRGLRSRAHFARCAGPHFSFAVLPPAPPPLRGAAQYWHPRRPFHRPTACELRRMSTVYALRTGTAGNTRAATVRGTSWASRRAWANAPAELICGQGRQEHTGGLQSGLCWTTVLLRGPGHKSAGTRKATSGSHAGQRPATAHAHPSWGAWSGGALWSRVVPPVCGEETGNSAICLVRPVTDAALFRAAPLLHLDGRSWRSSVLQPSSEFGEELRRRRLGAGVSLTALSTVVHYSKAQLSKVERGIKAPSRDLARLCDAALHASGALIALVAPPVTDVPKEPAPCEVDEEEWVMRLSPDGLGRFTPVGRRQVVSAGAASLMSWRTGGQGRVSPSGGAGMLDASRSLFTHYRRLGQSVEPGFLLPGLIAQTHTLRELSAHVDSRTGQELLALGSRLRRVCRLAGAGDG